MALNNFLKTGAASAQLASQAAAQMAARKDNTGKSLRFRLKPGESRDITFVDGDLSPEGFLLPPRWYEHEIFANNEFQYYFCLERTSPESHDKCPLEEASEFSALMAGFTIIDHTPYTVQNAKSKNVGKTYEWSRMFYCPKPRTFETLNKFAQSMGGLAGCRFNVSRVDSKDAKVGSIFIPQGKTPIADLKAKYCREDKDPKTNAVKMVSYFLPLDYEKEIVYRTGDDLRKLGIGTPTPYVQQSAPASNMLVPQPQPVVDYSSQL